jgi:hypothetical protein
VDTEELEALNSLHYIPVDVEGVLGPPFPVVRDQLLCLAGCACVFDRGIT